MDSTFARRAQREHCRLSAVGRLKLLRECEPFQFNDVTTGDKSWFQYHYELQKMLASSRKQITPYARTKLAVQTIMAIVFFTSTMLIIHEVLSKGRKFNQDHFISSVRP
jgi:hypothetical protein